MNHFPHLNYDDLANEYNQRYQTIPVPERSDTLLDLVQQVNAQRILEVGSGTGYWLNFLSPHVGHVYGLDYSRGMLHQAKNQPGKLDLSQGNAVHLPFQDDTFDLIYNVDAIHHFTDKRAYVAEAFRALRPGGMLAVIGHDPHNPENSWYVYDYFEAVYLTDLQRYPSRSAILEWMKTAGFMELATQTIERITETHIGNRVLRDPYLKKNSSSQLALLNEKTYLAGINKIRTALASKHDIVFQTDLHVKLIRGTKPA